MPLEIYAVGEQGRTRVEVAEPLPVGTERALATRSNVLDDARDLVSGRPIGPSGAFAVEFGGVDPTQQTDHSSSSTVAQWWRETEPG
ncbi:MAG TPA: hypothetical protein VMM14_01100 [Acidimicrobiia bacterium]|nr:hypothetical protein [Acidimicrobiia bacterium]